MSIPDISIKEAIGEADMAVKEKVYVGDGPKKEGAAAADSLIANLKAELGHVDNESAGAQVALLEKFTVGNTTRKVAREKVKDWKDAYTEALAAIDTKFAVTLAEDQGVFKG